MGITNHQRKSAINDNTSSSNLRKRGEIPYVSPDGGKTRYYADRCYLDAPTGLLEYQLDNKGKVGGASTNNACATVEHCNLCGEIREVQQIRGTIGSSNTPQPTRPLFDRSKLINSLDLSAAIIGTYTIGDFKYLSDELPMLFPRSGDVSANGKYVPTLVLHGQKAFSLERWSNNVQSKTKESSTAQDTNEPLKPRGGSGECSSRNSINQLNADEVMNMRGGGGESSSQDSTEQNFPGEHIYSKRSKTAIKNPSAENKRPCFTYENQQLKLPKTPKRLRMKRKGSSDNAVESNCRRNINASEQSINAGSMVEVIVIDSDSDDESKPKRNAKQTTTSSTLTKLPSMTSPKSQPPVSTNDEQGKGTLSPPLKIQQPRISMPLGNATSPPNRADNNDTSSPRIKRSAAPDAPISIDSPAGLMPKIAASVLPYAAAKPHPKIDTYPATSSPPKVAATIMAHALGKSQPKATMRPIFYDSGPDTSQESTMSANIASATSLRPGQCNSNDEKTECDNQPKMGWGGVKPVSVFDGEVFFTQVLPRWCPPDAKKRRASSNERASGMGAVEGKRKTSNATAANYSDEEDEGKNKTKLLREEDKRNATISKTKNEAEMATVRGVHHPKFFLLFERSGSLVVIISTSNLTPQNSTEGSWVQRFEPIVATGSGCNTKGSVDFGMPSDFGAVLTDFLGKQSEAAAGGMMPDVFLRRYVSGLSSGLNALSERYRFDEAQVHLVSTVPGDYISGLPRKGHHGAAYKPRIAYGPQRVSFILSRILNKGHICAAKAIKAAVTGRSRGSQIDRVTPWLTPELVKAKERLLIQPTSLGGNWTRDDLEVILQSYLQPGWDNPTCKESKTSTDGLLDLLDIVWPSMDCFDTMRNRRRAIYTKNPDAAAAIAEEWASLKDKTERGEGHVFLSSISFSKLDRSCISRMALFTHTPNTMPYKSASIHFKSVCRLLRSNEKEEPAPKSSKKTDSKRSMQRPSPCSKEHHLSWFMLTSACLSGGAQGRPTPYRDPASDSMSYSNFELGVLFCSRFVGDGKIDRLYVSDPGHVCGCQCGRGKRFYNRFADVRSVLESVRKVHLPIPYQLRAKPYQDDPDSDFMSHTPYMHDIPEGTGCVGNMKLTPLGQQIADDVERG